MGRSPCCDKSKVKRGTWSPEEDATLKNYIHTHGTGGNWISLPHRAGLQRCGKSCRLRWLNYLRPDIKHGGFTPDEEYVICNLYNKIGSRWSVIASHLPGRTDNDVKNYWNTKLKKKLMAPDCHPPTKTDTETAIAASNTAAATVAASGAVTTSQIVPSNFLTLQDYCFPVPFLPNAPSVSNDPINYNLPTFIIEGSSDCSTGNNMNFPFSPFHQDSSHFSPFCLGVDEINNGVKMDEYSCEQVVSGIWSHEEESSNADLFSIFHVDSKAQGVSQSH